MLEAKEKVARILRADKHLIGQLAECLGSKTGRVEVFEELVSKNDLMIRDKLQFLEVGREAGAKEIYDALISKIEADDHSLFKSLGEPLCHRPEDAWKIVDLAKKISGINHGFFLKKEKAVEFIKKEPPRKIMAYLGYDSAEEMLAKENLFEVYSALRFIEDQDWLNNIFFKQYENLTPADFEQREAEMMVLPEKWNKATEKFLAKKWHNISHLKELGVIFVIPATLGISGELLRTFSLIFHYCHEVVFYADIFKRLGEKNNSDFAKNVISLLRGDVVEEPPVATKGKSLWLVVQRYLAKDDENDWRLSAPHINPEAIHWVKVNEDMVKLGNHLNGFGVDFGFWYNLDWVGDYFKDEVGNDVLVSFNLVDTVMSLVKEKELIKYLYHHQEALWNRIFIGYFDPIELEECAKKYLLKGYFEI